MRKAKMVGVTKVKMMIDEVLSNRISAEKDKKFKESLKTIKKIFIDGLKELSGEAQ